MSLDEQLDQRRKEIFSDRLSMSIGELESLYARADQLLYQAKQTGRNCVACKAG